jgi:hypothetical protein
MGPVDPGTDPVTDPATDLERCSTETRVSLSNPLSPLPMSIVIYGTGTIHTIGNKKNQKKEATLCKTLIGGDVFL